MPKILIVLASALVEIDRGMMPDMAIPVAVAVVVAAALDLVSDL